MSAAQDDIIPKEKGISKVNSEVSAARLTSYNHTTMIMCAYEPTLASSHCIVSSSHPHVSCIHASPPRLAVCLSIHNAIPICISLLHVTCQYMSFISARVSIHFSRSSTVASVNSSRRKISSHYMISYSRCAFRYGEIGESEDEDVRMLIRMILASDIYAYLYMFAYSLPYLISARSIQLV